jgi:hypothetical protein
MLLPTQATLILVWANELMVQSNIRSRVKQAFITGAEGYKEIFNPKEANKFVVIQSKPQQGTNRAGSAHFYLAENRLLPGLTVFCESF